MRKKVTALMMVAAMACGALIACGSDSSTSTSTSHASETVYGEVTAVNDSGFTITVGTYSDGELTLGDESLDVAVTDSTKYSMSGTGQAPEGGKPADMPQGEGEGEAPADMPEDKPEGEAPAQATLDSISVGTQVAVTYDADGNVEAVEIL